MMDTIFMQNDSIKEKIRKFKNGRNEPKPEMWIFTDLDLQTQIKDISHLDLG